MVSLFLSTNLLAHSMILRPDNMVSIHLQAFGHTIGKHVSICPLMVITAMEFSVTNDSVKVRQHFGYIQIVNLFLL